MKPSTFRLVARRWVAVDFARRVLNNRSETMLLLEARLALRTLAKNPGFTALAVIMLAVAIGVNVTVFTVANAVLFAGFPGVVDNERLLYVDSHRDGDGGCCVSHPDFEDWSAQARSFRGMGAVADERVILDDADGLPAPYVASRVTTNTFGLIGQRPLLGRDFVPSDAVPGAAPVAILGYRLWERRFDRDPAVVGRRVRISGRTTTVVGVMGEGLAFPQNQDLWVPLVPGPGEEKREARFLWFAFGRLAEGATVESARAELETIGDRLATAHPSTNEGIAPRIRNFHAFFIGPNAASAYGAMWGAVGFVLLIACANLANLILARASGRFREDTLRLALGAGRWGIVRRNVVEGVTLSVMGGILGACLAVWGVRGYELAASPPNWFAGVMRYELDYRVLAYLLAISIGSGVVVGFAPLGRLSALDVRTALKGGGREVFGGIRPARSSRLIVTAEMGMALVLLASAGVLMRSFVNVYTADLGVETQDVLTLFLNLPEERYPGDEKRAAFFDEILGRFRTVPGVESVAMAWRLPAGGSSRAPFELEGAPPVTGVGERRPTVSTLVVGPGYFRTLGAVVLSGRELDASDRPSSPPVVVVNESFAARSWPGDSPVGKRLRLYEDEVPGPWRTVVGVVRDVVQDDVTRQASSPLVYLAFRDRPTTGMWVFARAAVPPESLVAEIRNELHAADPELPIWLGPFRLSDRLKLGYATGGRLSALFGIFAGIALLLAATGLYAVTAYEGTRRTKEIGIRMAMGASGRRVLALLVGEALLPVGLGFAVGLPASIVVNQALKTQLVGVSPVDPLTLLAGASVLLLVSIVGVLVPARRATRLDPAAALRQE